MLFLASLLLASAFTYAGEKCTISGEVTFEYDGDIYICLFALEKYAEFQRPGHDLSQPECKHIRMNDDLKKVTPSATSAKTHYVIVDAIGVTKSLKTASQPLITKPGVPMKDLAMGLMMGAHDEDTVSSLAGRLARLNTQLDSEDKQRIKQKADGPC